MGMANWVEEKPRLTDSAEDEQREGGDDPPIVIPQHSRSPRAYDIADDILDTTKRRKMRARIHNKKSTE